MIKIEKNAFLVKKWQKVTFWENLIKFIRFWSKPTKIHFFFLTPQNITRTKNNLFFTSLHPNHQPPIKNHLSVSVQTSVFHRTISHLLEICQNLLMLRNLLVYLCKQPNFVSQDMAFYPPSTPYP